MTKPAFTPGPWEASLEAARFIIQHIPQYGMGKRAIAYTGGAEPANPFNAHLIAAAPEMFEALERLFTVTVSMKFERGDGPPILNDAAYDKALAATRTALAKARGEQP